MRAWRYSSGKGQSSDACQRARKDRTAAGHVSDPFVELVGGPAVGAAGFCTCWSTFIAVALMASMLNCIWRGGKQFRGLALARLQRADEILENFLRADLGKQESYALFGDRADFVSGLALCLARTTRR